MAELGVASVVKSSASAILFMQAGALTMDVYSALNSSPWTSENFGADPEKAASCMEYVRHAMLWSTFYCGMAGIIDHSWWPVFGAVANNVYLYWLYQRALDRGAAAGSDGWASEDD